jgi:small subunit ribosomal protein S16
MLKIKLARFGKKKQPHYRIVVNEARDKRDGRSVDTIGQYAPTLTPKILNVDMAKYQDWLKKGAQPTDTVQALIARVESGNPFPAKKAKLSKKAKAKETAAKEAAATAQAEAKQAKAAPAPEAPTAEATESATPAAPTEATPEETK